MQGEWRVKIAQGASVNIVLRCDLYICVTYNTYLYTKVDIETRSCTTTLTNILMLPEAASMSALLTVCKRHFRRARPILVMALEGVL